MTDIFDPEDKEIPITKKQNELLLLLDSLIRITMFNHMCTEYPREEVDVVYKLNKQHHQEP